MGPVDALLAERLDPSAGALACVLECVGEVAADDRHVADRVRGVMEARVDGTPGLAYPLRHDDEAVDSVPDLQTEQREDDDRDDDQHVGDDAICEAMRNLGIEAHAALLPARREASRASGSAVSMNRRPPAPNRRRPSRAAIRSKVLQSTTKGVTPQ